MFLGQCIRIVLSQLLFLWSMLSQASGLYVAIIWVIFEIASGALYRYCPVSIEISCSSVTNVILTSGIGIMLSVFAGFVRASHLHQMYTPVKQLRVR